MDLTNETNEPVIVEAERGGGGDPPDPPYRYRLLKKDEYAFAVTGGVCRAAKNKGKADLKPIKKPAASKKMAVSVFQEINGYAGCLRISKGNLVYGKSYIFRRNGNKYEIVEAV